MRGATGDKSLRLARAGKVAVVKLLATGLSRADEVGAHFRRTLARSRQNSPAFFQRLHAQVQVLAVLLGNARANGLQFLLAPFDLQNDGSQRVDLIVLLSHETSSNESCQPRDRDPTSIRRLLRYFFATFTDARVLSQSMRMVHEAPPWSNAIVKFSSGAGSFVTFISTRARSAERPE